MNKPVSAPITILIRILVLLAMMPLVGCQSIKMKPQKGKLLQNIKGPEILSKKLSINETPNRMMIIWKDAVVRSSSGQTKKGFGGRVYFYGRTEEPIKVDGKLIVYGYDDTVDNDTSTPERKYVFKQENFESHYDPTELGHAYSVWLPWDDIGGHEKTISLVPFFEAEGIRISAGSSELTLPGKKPEVETFEKTTAPTVNMPNRSVSSTRARSAPSSGVVLASGIETDDSGQVQFASGELQRDEATQNRTHTIELPDSLKEKIQRAGPLQPFVKKRPNAEKDYRQAMKTLVDQRFADLEKKLGPEAKDSKDKAEVLPAGSFKRPKSAQPVFGQPAPFKRS